jgi:methylglutaconyl-CoA hydratase
MNEPQATRYEVTQGAAWITLARPENRNALSAQLVDELDEHFSRALAEPAARCIVITGSGSAFCAGADLKNPPGRAAPGQRGVALQTIFQRMLDSPKPVIAAVNGAAFAGGLGLVGASDIVIAVEDAPMSFSEVRIGVIPAIISVVCIPKLGAHHGMKLFLTGERFSAQQAVSMGFVHRAVPAAQLREAVQQEVDMIRLGGPIAVAECKKLVRRVQQLPVAQGFEEMAQWSLRMFTSEEAAEGMAAFREKRKPDWVEEG